MREAPASRSRCERRAVAAPTIGAPLLNGRDQRPVSLHVPESMRLEHAGIHEALELAMKEPGSIGEAAAELGKVLHPHFVREEQIALPPLGLLASLAAGALPADAGEALEMTDTLRRELPAMLEEHTRIKAAVGKLGAVARGARRTEYVRLADDLALHARTEEEVLYPAAVLVGDVIRARRQASLAPRALRER